MLAKLFKYDTTLLNEDDNLDRLIDKTILEKVCKYFQTNGFRCTQIQLNLWSFLTHQQYTNLMYLFHKNLDQNSPNLVHEIKPAIKYFGVYFDPVLSFKFQNKHIMSKFLKRYIICAVPKCFYLPML
jgi:hypothetical protein